MPKDQELSKDDMGEGEDFADEDEKGDNGAADKLYGEEPM